MLLASDETQIMQIGPSSSLLARGAISGQLSDSVGVVTLTQTFGYFQCSVNPESSATPGNKHLNEDSLSSD